MHYRKHFFVHVNVYSVVLSLFSLLFLLMCLYLTLNNWFVDIVTRKKIILYVNLTGHFHWIWNYWFICCILFFFSRSHWWTTKQQPKISVSLLFSITIRYLHELAMFFSLIFDMNSKSINSYIIAMFIIRRENINN